ncbi:hypothetical protein BG000_002362 [Podila horticola]|nr:hypothetical protein BG000_002362 [Podila horticola]
MMLKKLGYDKAYQNLGFKALLPKGVLLNNYHGLAHPSQPNYIAAINGNTQRIMNDSCPLTFSNSSIVDLLEAGKLARKTYQEDIPQPAPRYVRKHNPFINFANIPTNPIRRQHVLPATQFVTDLKNGKVPNC